MNDFWLSCGHHLLDRDEGGGLVITDEFLKVYLARPELAPPADACVVERTLHATLLADPRRPLDLGEIALIADADARENWEVMLGFRDFLLRHRTVEAAYVAAVRQGKRLPPLFLNQLVHVILRNVLDGCSDPVMLRAAELFFRPQLLTVHDGSLIAADEETIAGTNNAPVSPLVSMFGLPASGEIEMIGEGNAETYFERSDRFDMALDLTAGREGLAALGRVIEAWVGHVLSVPVEVEPLTELRDAEWSWYVGLDAEGTKIGDQLWRGEEVDAATQGRIVGFFRLTVRGPSADDLPDQAQPAYLLMAMTPERILRMKPQNLVVGLPLRHLEEVN